MSKLPHTTFKGLRLFLLGLVITSSSISSASTKDEPQIPVANSVDENVESAMVTVPFAPTLEHPNFYTVVIEKKRGKGESRLELEQELTFKALGDGFLLELDMLAVSINGRRFDLRDRVFFEALPEGAHPFLMSVQIELDADGEPIRLRDWEAKRKLLQQIPQMTLDRLNPDQREDALPAIRMIFDPLISSTAEEAPHAIVQGWPTILGYGGLQLELSETYIAESEIEGGLFLEPIAADVELSLNRTVGGNYRFLQTTRPNPQALLSATTAVVDRIREAKGDEVNPANLDQIDANISMKDDLDIVFEKGTGMPLSAVIAHTVGTNTAISSSHTITITRRSE